MPSVDAAVLAVLARTSRPLTGREVSRLCGHSQQGVQAILNRMTDHGLLDVTRAGPARLYTLNRQHVAADAAIVLADLRGRLFERIRQHLEGWEVPPLAAAVFGSAARGDGGPGSDIDILMVRPAGVEEEDPGWANAVDDLAQAVRGWSGNHAGILQVSPSQVAEMVRRGAPIVAELRTDAVPLSDVGVLETSGHPSRRSRQ